MKYITLFICSVLLLVSSAFAGQVGGSGGSALQSARELLDVYSGAQKISKDLLGSENMFSIDMQRKIVTFDAERRIVDESPVLTFEEVKGLADPEVNNQ
jgi:hypothetical protein